MKWFYFCLHQSYCIINHPNILSLQSYCSYMHINVHFPELVFICYSFPPLYPECKFFSFHHPLCHNHSFPHNKKFAPTPCGNFPPTNHSSFLSHLIPAAPTLSSIQIDWDIPLVLTMGEQKKLLVYKNVEAKGLKREASPYCYLINRGLSF